MDREIEGKIAGFEHAIMGTVTCSPETLT